MEPDCRISLFKKERPQQATQQMDRLYAWNKPHINIIIFISPDYNSHKIIKTLRF